MSQRSDYRVNITITSKDKTGTASKTAKKGMFDLAKAAQAAAVAFGILKTAQAAVDFVKAGAAIKRQQGALNNLAKAAGTSGDAIVSAIQSASDHTIDRMTAMSAANKALLLNVAQTPEQFSELTRVATLLGRAMGQDAASSINDFVVAAGRQSVMIADNLGLMVSAETANQRYADSHGILVSAMGKAEKSQAFLNEMLIQGAEKTKDLETSMLSAATKIEQAEAALSDIKGSFQELAAEIAVGSGTLDRWSAGLQGWKSVIDNVNVASEHFEEQTDRDRAAMERAILSTDALNQTYLTGAQIRGEITEGEILFAQAIEATSSEVYVEREAFVRSLPAMRDYHSLMEDAIQANKDAVVTAKDMATAVEDQAEAMLEAGRVAMRGAENWTSLLADRRDAAMDFSGDVEDIEEGHQERLAEIAKKGQSTVIRIDAAAQEKSLQRLKEDLAVALGEQAKFTEKTSERTRLRKERAIEDLGLEISAKETMLASHYAGTLINQGENTTAMLTKEAERYAEEKRLLDIAREEQELAMRESLGRMLLANLESWAAINKVAPEELQKMRLAILEKYGMITDEGKQAWENQAKNLAATLAVMRGDVAGFFEFFMQEFNKLPDEKVIRIRAEAATAGVPGGERPRGEFEFASGGVSEGGRARVGEFGPEFVDLPRGSIVHNAGDTSNMMNSNNTYNVNDPAGAAMMAEQARAASQSRFARGAGM